MDFYTLDEDFLKKEVIDQTSSAIWTERYSTAGDTTLVVDATPDNIGKLAEGTFLSLEGSKEVMLLETQSIENNLLTVTGNSLLAFLTNRVCRDSLDPDQSAWHRAGYKPAELLANLVTEMCIGGSDIEMYAAIPNLGIGFVDDSGTALDIAVPFGDVYDNLVTLAATYSLGISLFLDSASYLAGYNLTFTAYAGRDLTSDDDTYPLVRFSPAMGSLNNIKELRSIAGYKNVVFALPPSDLDGLYTLGPGIAYADGDAETSIGFDRRVLIVVADDITSDSVGGDSTALLAALNQRAKDALANNNYIKMFDGQVVLNGEFQYGVHYGLGDIVELQARDGSTQKARITEYIRTQDNTGEKAYPTVSVIS